MLGCLGGLLFLSCLVCLVVICCMAFGFVLVIWIFEVNHYFFLCLIVGSIWLRFIFLKCVFSAANYVFAFYLEL
jgi:hypothetical protein